VAGGDDPGRDLSNLLGFLPQAEHYFRKSLTNAPVMIDAREPEVLEGGLAYKLKEAGVCGLRRKRAGADFFEQGAKLGAVHRPKWLAFVDFPFSRAIKSAIVPRDGFISL
jgi:hypothetical protein